MAEVSPETAALRSALEAANRGTEAERARRIDAEGRLRTETGTRFAAQEAAVDTALSQAETNATALQGQWAALQAEGKFEEAAAAMRAMGDTTARIAQLKGQKEWYGQQKQQAAAAPADPLAQFNSTEREWIAKNPRYTEDPAFTRRVNAAATHAVEFEGLVKDSPEYWQHIEGKVYPERAQQAAPAQGEQAGETAPAGESGEGSEAGDGGTLEQQHTRNIPVTQPRVDAPAMHVDLEKPDAPQQRAVGRGGEGIRAVAAPPSRRIAEAANRVGRGAARIEPTMQEVEVARSLYEAIEPNAKDRSDETIIRWYYALAHDPSHLTTRRKNWAPGAIV